MNLRNLFVSLAILISVFQFGTASAQKGAAFYIKAGNSTTYYYTPHLMKSLDAARQELKTAFNKYNQAIVYDWERPGVLHPLKIRNTLVFDDRIEFILKRGDKRTLYFSKLFGNKWIFFSKKITVGFGIKYRANISYDKSYYHALLRNSKRQYDTLSIFVPVDINRNQFTTMDQMPYVNALYTIQDHMVWQHRDSLLQAFKSIALKYRAMEVKPKLSEEQRKYVVQANFYAKQKKYSQAIMLYRKVIKINPTSYPVAYNNLALLYAQVNQFPLAIFYMRHYLFLEPDAKDARAGQDKIYEWDLMVKHP